MDKASQGHGAAIETEHLTLNDKLNNDKLNNDKIESIKDTIKR